MRVVDVKYARFFETVADDFLVGYLRDPMISPIVTAGLDTLAVRIPDHPRTLDLLRVFGGPVAAPAANPAGQISPTPAAHVAESFAGGISAVLDTGPTTIGLESTILDVTRGPVLLRHGGIPKETLESFLGHPIEEATTGEAIRAPGQLQSHYAPNARVQLNQTLPSPRAVLIGFGEIKGDLTLSAKGDLVEAAAQLFALLRKADTMGKAAIHIAPIPNDGIGRAINDRLTRAAAPKA